MGQLISSFVQKIVGERKIWTVLHSADGSPGQTTILYQLAIGKVVPTVRTHGMSAEEVRFNGVIFTVDMSQPDPMAVIFVVDSSNRDAMEEARFALHHLVENKFRSAASPRCLLIFANKQDLPRTMSVNEVQNKLDLHLLTDVKWHIQGCSAVTGDGLYEGLQWISTVLPDARPWFNVRRALEKFQLVSRREYELLG